MPLSQLKYHCWRARNIILFLGVLSLIGIYRHTQLREADIAAIIPFTAIRYVMFKDKFSPPLCIAETKRLINEKNEKQTILNEDLYGRIKDYKIIIVIPVKQLTIQLKYLVASLSQVSGIWDALIIFSHSTYDENFNEFVSSINFCRVTQMFYPYSLQVNPNMFPGFEKGDCPYNIPADSAQHLNCTGAFTPDINGHYRSPWLAQGKHHWWWTANKVFNGIKSGKYPESLVVFLNDDMYVFKDFLHILMLLKYRAESFETPTFLSLGTASKVDGGQMHFRFATITMWDPNYSGALAFDLKMWKIIESQHKLFCEADDYTWARSLMHLSTNSNSSKLSVLSIDTPRAYQISHSIYETIGSWVNTWAYKSVYRVLKLQDTLKEKLFPTCLTVHNIPYVYLKWDYHGGWSDPRDRQLCKDMVLLKEHSGTTKKSADKEIVSVN